ncbi:Primary amine oxidase [Modestobacter italicus]|uniref:Amine oxidase n=1 Tax=Modestobacter italicus (strain DSM 44449 / CECT 9708 / BC 501) TaxID=2732864 RepID=I4F1U0_MODI5|nr:primary-amine oxidase [Modestobacter marinus]CCH89603.1 Primary amine oxidase [Modestobacter marinus]
MTLIAGREAATTTLPGHPLEPLAPEELSAASALLRADDRFPADARFVFLELAEPPKDVVATWTPGTGWDRRAAAVLRSPGLRATFEATVSLSGGEVVSWRHVEGVQPPMTAEEFMACEDVVRADPDWQAAMRARGVEDFSLVMLDPWASGYTGPDDHPSGRRLARPLTFVRSKPDDNGYARPVEGLVVTVDMDTMTVVDVADHGIVPLPPQPGNYLPEMLAEPGNVGGFPAVREPMKPISITQPEGPSFTVEGHAVEWGPWRLRIGFTPREGLVLHDVGYVDKGVLRPVLYRASLSEMFVPYGDPRPTHWNKNVFDEGEYGLGWLANPLELGCDCLGEIRYFDGYVNDQDGEPVRIGNAVCMHEEDASIGWKHTDFRTGRAEVRRNRRLVVSMIATVGNYDYGFYWNLYLDGSIEFEVKLTGILSTGALPVGEDPVWGTTIAPGLMAPNHEHYFSVRLDMAVDGPRNNLFEVDSVSDPAGPENPYGNAWRTRKRQLTSESEAQRLPDPLAGRSWLVSSADTESALGARPSYKIEPGPYTAPLWQQGSEQAERGGFATRQLWATPYDPAQRFAAGDYVAQNPGPDGLVAYTADDRSLVDSDLVVWYTVGAHHVVRPEDWPVMPVTKVGFHLKPFGFFDGNPMLDLPAEGGHCAPTVAGGCGDSCTCGH